MRKVPIEFSRFAVEQARLQFARVDANHGRDFGKIAGGEDLVGGEEIRVAQRLLDHDDAIGAKQADHALARDAVEEGAVRHRREDDAVFRHEHI
jgi:hypothetical protein